VVSAFQSSLSGIATDATSHADDLSGAAGAFQAVFAGVTSPADLRCLAGAISPLVEASQAALVGTMTPVELAIAENAAATDMFLYASILANAADAAANASYTTYDDAIAARDSLSTQVIQAELYTSDADVFSALQDLRGGMVQAISDEAMTLPRTRTLELRTVKTAIELAYDLYGDATRADEIVSRNGFADPAALFGSIQVLTV